MQTNWTRRGFLRASAAVAGASLVAGKLRFACGADGAAKKSRYPLGLQSYTFREFPVEKAIDMAHELGFAAIEFSVKHFPPASSDDHIAEIKSKMSAAGMRISAHGVNEFGKDHAANRRIFVFAKKIGIKYLSAYPSEDAFDSLEKLVAEFDIRIAIHNHGPGALYSKIADVLVAIKGRDPRIGACADLGHYIRSAEDPVKAITLLNDRLFGVHLKDFAEQTATSRGVILGKGHLDVEGVYKALAKVNFPADGALSLEYEENPRNPVPDVKECIAVAREAEAKAFG
jgi:sugar phosphate isomerase/epimerase